MPLPARVVADPLAQLNFEWLNNREYVVSSSSITWPGGTPVSNTTTVTHALGWRPSIVVPGNIWDKGFQVTANARIISATQFELFVFYGTFSPAAPSTTTLPWIAFR